MWIAIVMMAVLGLVLLLWAVQIISPAPWERRRRRRHRVGSRHQDQARRDALQDDFSANSR